MPVGSSSVFRHTHPCNTHPQVMDLVSCSALVCYCAPISSRFYPYVDCTMTRGNSHAGGGDEREVVARWGLCASYHNSAARVFDLKPAPLSRHTNTLRSQWLENLVSQKTVPSQGRDCFLIVSRAIFLQFCTYKRVLSLTAPEAHVY
jgi:hypothetical protein